MTDRLFYRDDPAALIYQAFGHAKNWRDSQGKMKLWHELSSIDRVAWRAAFNAYREETGLGSHVVVPLPPDDQLLVTASRGLAYASHVVSVELLRTAPDAGTLVRSSLLPRLTESLDKVYADSGRESPEGTPI